MDENSEGCSEEIDDAIEQPDLVSDAVNDPIAEEPRDESQKAQRHRKETDGDDNMEPPQIGSLGKEQEVLTLLMEPVIQDARAWNSDQKQEGAEMKAAVGV